MFNWADGKTEYKMSIFPDDSPAIDFVLDESLVRRIYDSWDESKYGQLLDFGGGVRAITAKMIKQSGVEFLMSIRNIGEKKASQIMEAIDAVMEEVPHGGGV
jgi:ERCC4-type nuclease